MHVFKLGVVRVSMTKTAIEESQVHLQVRKGKATLTADEFRDLYEWCCQPSAVENRGPKGKGLECRVGLQASEIDG